MKGKIAIVTIELLASSYENIDEDIRRELIKWFQEDAFLMPWAKEVRSIVVKEE